MTGCLFLLVSVGKSYMSVIIECCMHYCITITDSTPPYAIHVQYTDKLNIYMHDA